MSPYGCTGPLRPYVAPLQARLGPFTAPKPSSACVMAGVRLIGALATSPSEGVRLLPRGTCRAGAYATPSASCRDGSYPADRPRSERWRRGRLTPVRAPGIGRPAHRGPHRPGGAIATDGWNLCTFTGRTLRYQWPN